MSLNLQPRRKLHARPNWSIPIGSAPATPSICFFPAVDKRRFAEACESVGLEGGACYMDEQDACVNVFQNESDDETAMLSRVLAYMHISHHAFYRVGGVWMMQMVLFDKDYQSSGIICWPCDENVTHARATALAAGAPAPGLQRKLAKVFAAGGYVALDLNLLGVTGFETPLIRAGHYMPFDMVAATHLVRNSTLGSAQATAFRH